MARNCLIDPKGTFLAGRDLPVCLPMVIGVQYVLKKGANGAKIKYCLRSSLKPRPHSFMQKNTPLNIHVNRLVVLLASGRNMQKKVKLSLYTLYNFYCVILFLSIVSSFLTFLLREYLVSNWADIHLIVYGYYSWIYSQLLRTTVWGLHYYILFFTSGVHVHSWNVKGLQSSAKRMKIQRHLK